MGLKVKKLSQEKPFPFGVVLFAFLLPYKSKKSIRRFWCRMKLTGKKEGQNIDASQGYGKDPQGAPIENWFVQQFD